MPTSITSSGITFDDATTQTTSALAAGAIGATQLASGAVTPAKLSQPFTLATSVATTSGTSIDVTSIPSWVKRITFMFNGVSTNGSSIPLIRLGDAGGVEATGYVGAAADYGAWVGRTDGFPLSRSWLNNYALRGAITFSLFDPNTNLWVASGAADDAAAFVISFGGAKSLSETLDRIRLTTVNGTDTFDAGSVNISYEG
jgi:hypothetical protein